MCGFNVYEEERPDGTYVVIDGIRHEPDCTGGLMDVWVAQSQSQHAPWDDWAARELFGNPELFE